MGNFVIPCTILQPWIRPVCLKSKNIRDKQHQIPAKVHQNETEYLGFTFGVVGTQLSSYFRKRTRTYLFRKKMFYNSNIYVYSHSYCLNFFQHRKQPKSKCDIPNKSKTAKQLNPKYWTSQNSTQIYS